jgi:antitoxin YefM
MEEKMEALTYTTARQNLARTMDKVCDDLAPVIITRKKHRSVVMMSLEEYNSLKETAYLLQSPKNAQRLLNAISGIDSGGGQERELLEGE